MKRYFLFLTCLFQGFLISCKEPVSYIITTDIQKIFEKTRKGKAITEEESNILDVMMLDSVQENTIGKRIPEILIKDLTNKPVNLQDVLTSNSVIISSDVHCAFGYEFITNTFPKAQEKLINSSYEVPAICLLKRTAYDYEDSARFKKVMAELTVLYNNLYIIDEQEAYKINLVGNTVRLYINEDQVVSNMQFGSCTVDNLYKEIKGI